ncbi:synergin gamma-like isoform X2 [Ambystoma mexicanum]
MESEVVKLKTCLENIHKVIRKANDILCSISQPSVCSEVLLSAQGTAYILGVAEVYRVSKRVEGGMKTLHIASETLQHCLKDIDLAWNNLQAFLSLCPSVLHMLPPEQSLSCEVSSPELESTPHPDHSCGVCLMEVPDDTLDTSENREQLLMHQGHPYHVSCANFWLNCVDTELPSSSCQQTSDLCTKPLEPTECPGLKSLLEGAS